MHDKEIYRIHREHVLTLFATKFSFAKVRRPFFPRGIRGLVTSIICQRRALILEQVESAAFNDVSTACTDTHCAHQPFATMGFAAFGTDHARTLFIESIFFLVLAAVAVAGRFIGRRMRRVPLSWDDWLCAGALVSSCIPRRLQVS